MRSGNEAARINKNIDKQHLKQEIRRERKQRETCSGELILIILVEKGRAAKA